MFAREPKATRVLVQKNVFYVKKWKKAKSGLSRDLKGSPASRGKKKDLHLSQNGKKSSLDRGEKKEKNTRPGLWEEKQTHSSLYFTTLLVLKCRLRCQHRPRRSGANSLCIRFVSSRRLSRRSFYYSLVVRESFSRFHLSISLFWGEIFSLFLSLQRGSGCENGWDFPSARGDKNARKRMQTRIFIRAEDRARFARSFGSRIGGFARA